MNWTELEKTWQAQLPRFAPAEWQPAEFEQRRRQLARTLARRDWLEAGASLLAAGGFTAVLVLLRVNDWRGWLAVGLLLALGVGFVRERQRVRRLRVAPGAPLLVQLEAEIAELRHQAHLLRTVALWYLAPILASIALLGWALVRKIAAAGVTVDYGSLCWIGGASVALAVAVGWLNHWTARTWIEPQLAAREKARAEWLAE